MNPAGLQLAGMLLDEPLSRIPAKENGYRLA